MKDPFSQLDEVGLDGKLVVVNFSGGKDSTVALDLVARYVMDCGVDAILVVIYNESWLDLPVLRRWVYSHLDAVRLWGSRADFPVLVSVVYPPEGKDFFTLVLERGWALPKIRRHAPWCTKEMKTRPSAKLIRGLARAFRREVVYVTGARASESVKRRKSVEGMGVRNGVSRIRLEYIGEVDWVSPVWFWSAEDVLSYMRSRRSVFGDSFDPLLELYARYAVGGQKLRSGCWVCPLVKRDYFLEAYASEHPEWRIVIDAREEIIRISEDVRFRTAVINGKPAGRLTLEARRRIACVLRGLLDTGVGRELLGDYLVAVPSLRKLIFSLCS